MSSLQRADQGAVSPRQPSDAQTYITAARRLASGVSVLAKGGAVTSLACSVLASEALECALKAYLSSLGFTINRLTHPPLNRDLESLWVEAAIRGLNVAARPPLWCRMLNEEHGMEFAFRDLTTPRTMQYPAIVSMAVELEDLLNIIGRTI